MSHYYSCERELNAVLKISKRSGVKTKKNKDSEESFTLRDDFLLFKAVRKYLWDPLEQVSLLIQVFKAPDSVLVTVRAFS